MYFAFVFFLSFLLLLIIFIGGFIKLKNYVPAKSLVPLLLLIACTFSLTFWAGLGILGEVVSKMFGNPEGPVAGFKTIDSEMILLLVTIIIVVVKYIPSMKKLIKSIEDIKAFKAVVPEVNVLSRKEHKERSTEEWIALLGKENGKQITNLFIELRNFAQLGIFASLAILLTSQFINVSPDDLYASVPTSYIIGSIIMFLILDDWNIMHEYSMEREGNLIKFHRRKMFVINLILVFSGLIYLLVGKAGSSTGLLPIFLILLIANFYWRHFYDLNKYQDINSQQAVAS
ncbi:MAG: hypothetical protein AAF502_19445 [Bacteroidota bacterium]